MYSRPDSWSDLEANIGAYSKSKTLAERAAWKAVEGGSMELVVINPGGVFGPWLGATIDGQSVAMMTDMIAGKIPMIPDVAMGMIDVRDVTGRDGLAEGSLAREPGWRGRGPRKRRGIRRAGRAAARSQGAAPGNDGGEVPAGPGAEESRERAG